MPPHGGGVAGTSHSHDPEWPDDDWNLYSHLSPETTSFNATIPTDAIRIFKPHALRLSPEPDLVSDADQELIIVAKFESPVKLRKMIVIGGGEDPVGHPNRMLCYVNQEGLDFTNIASARPSQEFNLPVNPNGDLELITTIHAFSNINLLTFYFPSNHGDVENTVIRYIGMQGEHTHYRREAVNTMYEVLCNGQDIEQHGNSLATGPHLH